MCCASVCSTLASKCKRCTPSTRASRTSSSASPARWIKAACCCRGEAFPTKPRAAVPALCVSADDADDSDQQDQGWPFLPMEIELQRSTLCLRHLCHLRISYPSPFPPYARPQITQ